MDFRNNDLKKKIKSERMGRAIRAKSLDLNHKYIGIHSTVFPTLSYVWKFTWYDIKILT